MSGPFSRKLYKKFNGTHESEALLRFVCGRKLGRGIAREVFECSMVPGWVIKIANGSTGISQNILEYEVWDNVSHTEHAKWFAPVHSISPCGNILMMKQAKPLKSAKGFIETKLPTFLTDLKAVNFGTIGKQIVAVDYGRTLLMQQGLSKRMRDVKLYVES